MFLVVLFGLATTVAATIHVDIVGGEVVPASMFPEYIALLVDAPHHAVTCTGSLIAPSYILTAAHCVAQMSWAYLGSNSANGDDAIELVQLVNRIVHPKFDLGYAAYDVALHELATPSNRTPAAISWDDDRFNAPGVKAWIRGYGKMSDKGPIPKTLLQAQVVIQPYTTCVAQLGYVNAETMICAGGGKANDTCAGDSGAPLTVFKDGKEQIVGIASSGAPSCGTDIPSVYMRMSSVKSFIDSVIPPPKSTCFERPTLS
ncbi:hypothetical protein LEN26_008319 [Aphanomyces euteiches]|nr:hypothetical protein AeMF1_017738 [Aphanomyces euteiches]KAH9130666.1 hypothetical protein LEN26_008319 [Aphanomyces euteiches]KAH9186276.1 hypothetical protein AeNC1_011748 [Aphanomyces euteiches]